MQTVYFHEDEYCQVELLPVSAAGKCAREMGRHADFSSEHWTGSGWSDIYVRDDHSKNLRAMGLTIERIHEIVSPFLAACDEVYTGYSTHRERCERVRAWSDPAGYILFASFNDEHVIGDLWLSSALVKEANIELWVGVLRAVDELGGFVIADWNSSMLVRCSDSGAVASYLRWEHFDDDE